MGRIRQARRRAGLSQEELAKTSGVSPATVAQVELGHRQPQGRTLRKLAAALGVEVAELVEEEVNEAPKVRRQPEENAKGFDLPELKAVRERRGMSRDELAFRTGVPTAIITQFEEGTKRADMDTVQLLAFTLDTFSAELIVSREQFEAFKAEDERQNRWIAEQRAKRSPEEVAADDSPAMRKLRDAFVREDERRKRERPETA